MGYSRDQLLEQLKDLKIEYDRYDHPVVLTVEAQAKYVGHLGGGLSKNLFLKDKKQRFYIVTALAGTTVDLKVLSQRLGLGKGGLRMAPEEALQEMLQVPLGCVTPFALINDSARNVSLLLDQGLKARSAAISTHFQMTSPLIQVEHSICAFFNPNVASNGSTDNVRHVSALTARDLDTFLISIGKNPSYVDLEANPSVGKDQPPDLAALVPSGTTVLTDQTEKVVSTKLTTANDVPLENKSKSVTDKAIKQQSKPVQSLKEKPKSVAHPPTGSADVGKLVDEIINKASVLLLSEITNESIQQHGEQLGAVVSDGIKKHLRLDLESLAMTFKNTAVTEGFLMGTQAGNMRCPR